MVTPLKMKSSVLCGGQGKLKRSKPRELWENLPSERKTRGVTVWIPNAERTEKGSLCKHLEESRGDHLSPASKKRNVFLGSNK